MKAIMKPSISIYGIMESTMKSRISILLVCVLLLLPGRQFATVMPSIDTSYYDNGLGITGEMLIQAEKRISTDASMLFAGGGVIHTCVITGAFEGLNTGPLAVIEIRKYFGSQNLDKIYASLFYSIGYLYSPQKRDIDYYEFMPVQSYGVKLGYKRNSGRLDLGALHFKPSLEPYMTFGMSEYYQSENMGRDTKTHWTTVWLNLGIRIGFGFF